MKKQSYLKLLTSMVLFGTIGLFVRHISLPSSLIALVRGVIGSVFLLAVMALSGKKFSLSDIRKNAVMLFLSGAFLGLNWVALFESYRYTSVAVSTLCYYMAPVLVILASPLVLKEKMTGRKLMCVILAICGAVCISGVFDISISGSQHGKGILLGLTAALLYASIMLINKRMGAIDPYSKTVVQLGVSAVVMLCYCLLTGAMEQIRAGVEPKMIILLLIVGVVHTGITYFLYFGAMEYISGQSIAMISYLDPLVAILVSVTLLRDPIKPLDILGGLLILGAAAVSEFPTKKG